MPISHDLRPKWPYFIAKFASIEAIALGVAALLGNVFHSWLTVKLSASVLALKPNTMLCFIFTGIALWMRCEKSKTYTQYIIQICCAFIFLISFLTLFEYTFNVNLYIDEFFLKEPLSQLQVFFPPGRMSPFSAINFILIGFSLFFLDNDVIRYRVHQLFVIIVLLISYYELLVHIYNIGFRAVANPFFLPEIPVIITFILLGLGVLFVRPYQGVVSIFTSNAGGGVLGRKLIPPTLILPIFLGYLELYGKSAGLYTQELGIALLIMTICVFFTILVLIYAYFANQYDISREQAEFALKSNQSRLQAILDNTSSIISIYDMEGRFLLVNKQFEKLFHLSNAEVKGKKVREVLSEELANTILETHEKVIQSHMPIAVEEKMTIGNNDYIYLSNKFPIVGSRGLSAVCNISTDITEINQMHADLRERQERLNLALKSAEAGTWSWDIQKNNFVWDEYLHLLFGIKPGSFPGYFEFIFNFIHPDDRERVRSEIETILKKGGEYESEYRIVLSNGVIRYLATRGHAYCNGSGQSIRMAGICWDITERKHVETELRQAKEIAEHLAEEAKMANNAKSAFLAAMSHEIRTPLNGIIGMTGLLLDAYSSSEQYQTAQTIHVSGEALLSVINDILDYSKIEYGQMKLEQIDLDFHTLIEDTVDIFAAQAHRKGLGLGVHIASDIPAWLRGDPVRIRQILNNLLSNAVKFTKKGEISVKIKIFDKEKTESNLLKDKKITLLLEVIDTGVGMKPEIRDYLFQPFSQGDRSTSRKYGGTGLGLAITKRLVKMMDGMIGIDSYPGRGSRIWATLQLNRASEPKPKMEYPLVPEFDGVRILCVDDSAINREIAKSQTEAWHMRCDVAANAAEGLAMLKHAAASHDPYQIALIDYIMPDMNGIELIQIIRQLKDICHTRIVILSSLGVTFGNEDLKSLDVSLNVTKPMRPAKLYEVIAIALNKLTKRKEDTHPVNCENHNLIKKKSRILLAEDNSVNTQVALRMLAKFGYQADTVENGLEAVRAAQNNSYDLILMDCQMPEMDGYMATKEIREFEISQNKNTPIIAMTAHALKGDREKCIGAGMDDYISKPIDIKVLESVLERWLPAANAAPEQSEEPSLIDMERLHVIFNGDTKAIKEFFNIFIDATTLLLKDVEKSINNKDNKLAKELIHRLKGSSGNSGIIRMHALCVKVEEKVLQSEWNEVQTLYQSMVDEFDKLQVEVKKKFNISNFMSDREEN